METRSGGGSGVPIRRGDWRWWRSEGRNLFGDREAGTTKQLENDGAAEAGGIVFHQNGSICLVEAYATNTVDIVKVRDSAHSVFRRMLSVAELDIDICGHISIINGRRG
jgi:hypothetical protein